MFVACVRAGGAKRDTKEGLNMISFSIFRVFEFNKIMFSVFLSSVFLHKIV